MPTLFDCCTEMDTLIYSESHPDEDHTRVLEKAKLWISIWFNISHAPQSEAIKSCT